MDERDYARLVDYIEYPEKLETGEIVINKGRVGRSRGFEFIVYSDDHDKHFHVIHSGRGIDARFSFPEIKLIDYKSHRGVIKSKEENNVRVFFQDPDNFEKLKGEFEKRSRK